MNRRQIFLCAKIFLVRQVVLRGSISYNTEFQRPLQYHLELRHLPDNYTFMVMEDTMYSVQGFEVKLRRKVTIDHWPMRARPRVT